MKTQKEVKLKTGEIVPKGTKVTEWKVNGNDSHCRLATGNVVRVTSVFKEPSIASLENWSCGIAKAVDGAKVEPDGYSPDGAPSWLLVCGLI
jgi:hypothetical protein